MLGAIDESQMVQIKEELNRTPLPGRIAEVHRLKALYLPEDEQVRTFREGIRGWLAGERLLSYMGTMDHLDELRVNLGKRVALHKNREILLRRDDPVNSMRARLEASQVSGMQEVSFHYFCLAISRVERLLLTMAECVSSEIAEEHLQVLSPYRAGRDYYEHYEDRIPNGPRYRASKHEIATEDGVTLTFGLESQGNDQLLLGKTVLDISTEGLNKVRDSVGAIWNSIGVATTRYLIDFIVQEGEIKFSHEDIGSGPQFDIGFSTDF